MPARDVSAPSSEPRELKVVGDVLFFSANDGIHGRELWRWRRDPQMGVTGRVELVDDLYVGTQGSEPRFLFVYGNWLYFVAAISEGKDVLWICGSHEGTPRPVKTAAGGYATMHVLCGAGSRWVYFFGPDDSGDASIFRTELGSSIAERIGLDDIRPEPHQLAATTIDNILYFYSHTGYICCLDGSGRVTRIAALESKFIPGLPGLPGGMFLWGVTSDHGWEPYITGGTTETTRLLRDIKPGPATSVQHLGATVFEHAAYFAADDGAHGIELWKTDGTSDGTVMIKDVCSGSSSSDPRYFTAAGGCLFFVADDGRHGPELWTTGGSHENTHLVQDSIAGPQGSGPWSLTEFKERVWFCAKSPLSGEEILCSDGTEEGTRVALDLVPGPGDSSPHNLTPFVDVMLFTCDDGIHGEELWVSDGTMEQTRLVLDIWPPSANPGSTPRHLTAFGGRLFFTANDAEHGEELWSSDGTESGTALVADLAAGTNSSLPVGLTPSATGLYFAADHGLWIIRDAESPKPERIVGGETAQDFEHLTVLGSRLFFTAKEASHGRELWALDSTRRDAHVVKDISSGPDDTHFINVFTLWDALWLYVQDSENQAALWVTDGTESGTERLLSIAIPCQDWDIDHVEAIALQIENTTTRELTEKELLVPLVCPIPGAPESTRPVSIDGWTYFVCRTTNYGAELCRTDGTLDGTRLVCDLFPGVSSSSPSHLCALEDRICFIAEHPREGRVVCDTDGTPDETRPMLARVGDVPVIAVRAAALISSGRCLYVVATDLPNDASQSYSLYALRAEKGHAASINGLYTPMAASNQFRQITPLADRVYLTFDDGIHGEELWTAVDIPELAVNPVPQLVKDILVPAQGGPRESGP